MLGDDRPIVVLARTKKRFEKLNNWSNVDTLIPKLIETYKEDYKKLRYNLVDFKKSDYLYLHVDEWVKNLPKDILQYVSAFFFSKKLERHIHKYSSDPQNGKEYYALENYPCLTAMLKTACANPEVVEYFHCYNATK